MTSTKEKLFSALPKLTANPTLSSTKVTIIGSGQVASTIAYTLLLNGVSDKVVIVDKSEDRLKAEFQDLLYGSYFLKETSNIQGTTDYSSAKNSQIVILAIDVVKIEGEEFSEFLQRNVDVYKATVPNVVQFCSDAVFIVVSSICDILSYVTWKLSGMQKSKIIGIGTSLETSRFRSLIANKIGVSQSQIQSSWIIGEQMKSFPVWSSVNILGIKLHEINPNAGVGEVDHENWIQICKEMEKSKHQITRFKNNSTYAIALCCADLVKTILLNTNEVKTVSVMIKDFFGIDKEVFLSVPCALNIGGVENCLNIKLNDHELKILRNSSSVIDEIQKGINF